MMDFTSEETEILSGLGVQALALFGSRAQGVDGPMSDYDFGVLLDQNGIVRRAINRGEVFNKIYDLLTKKVGSDLSGIDVVFLYEAPLELRQHVARFGQVLFEIVPGAFANFASATNLLYADFEPLRLEQQKVLLNRVNYASSGN